MSGAVNFLRTRTGRVRAVCQCCGRQGQPVRPDTEGGPSLWQMAGGWSTAPYPADFQHRDGSTGSTYTCPACNKELHAGKTLQLRAYMRPAAAEAGAAQGAAA